MSGPPLLGVTLLHTSQLDFFWDHQDQACRAQILQLQKTELAFPGEEPLLSVPSQAADLSKPSLIYEVSLSLVQGPFSSLSAHGLAWCGPAHYFSGYYLPEWLQQSPKFSREACGLSSTFPTSQQETLG